MKKILFISSAQYGYNTDYYKYCCYLSKEYAIDFVCFDSNQPRYDSDSIHVFYTEYKKGFASKVRLMKLGAKKIREMNPDYVFIKYFPGCSLLYHQFKDKKMIIDIRTGSVEGSAFNRKLKDMLKRFEANQFRHITVITEGLANKLRLRKEKTVILPLGADKCIKRDPPERNENELNLLYIGTFEQRKITDTIHGFKLFMDAYGAEIQCKYTIIGFGTEKEEEKIISLINELNLNQSVSFLGRKKHNELSPYYETHNIGISYIPITDYFQYQPPTKTYEYICNGLICLASNTHENAKIINDENGVRIGEGAQEFCNGLEEIRQNLDRYNRSAIMRNSEQYNWENIVNNILKPFLERI